LAPCSSLKKAAGWQEAGEKRVLRFQSLSSKQKGRAEKRSIKTQRSRKGFSWAAVGAERTRTEKG
jgi:hypothetical protein